MNALWYWSVDKILTSKLTRLSSFLMYNIFVGPTINRNKHRGELAHATLKKYVIIFQEIKICGSFSHFNVSLFQLSRRLSLKAVILCEHMWEIVIFTKHQPHTNHNTTNVVVLVLMSLILIAATKMNEVSAIDNATGG